MMKFNDIKIASLSLLIGLSFFSSVSFGMSCSSLLSVDRRARVEQDVMALEVIASLALAKEIQNTRGVLGSVGFFTSHALSFFRQHRYGTLPRLDNKSALGFSVSSPEFNQISDADREFIQGKLPDLMRNLISNNQQGDSFNRSFDENISALMDRNDEYIEAFVFGNLDAIIVNAVRMPKIPIGARFRSALGHNMKRLSLFSLAAGVGLELLNPNGLYIWLEPDPNRVFAGVSDKMYELGQPIRLIATPVLIHLGVLSPAQAVAVTLDAGVKSLQARFLNIFEGGYNAGQYDSSLGSDARAQMVDLILED